jgi:hypothetical protein
VHIAQTPAGNIAEHKAPGFGTVPIPGAVDQIAAAPAPTAAAQDADEPQDAAPVKDVPAPPAADACAAPAAVPALTMLTSTDTPDSSSDSALVTASDSSTGPVAATAAAVESAPSDGWLPGSSGLLLPATYTAGAEPRELIVPGRPAPVPGPRPVAPASARTDRTRPARTAVRTESRTEHGAKPRTDDAARTDEAHTQRPARTDVVAELVSAIRTDAGWRPDYEALADRTGYKRSFLEKCVGDARRAAATAV